MNTTDLISDISLADNPIPDFADSGPYAVWSAEKEVRRALRMKNQSAELEGCIAQNVLAALKQIHLAPETVKARISDGWVTVRFQLPPDPSHGLAFHPALLTQPNPGVARGLAQSDVITNKERGQ